MKKILVDVLSLAAVLDYFDSISRRNPLPFQLQQYVRILESDFANFIANSRSDRKRSSSHN